MKFNKRRSLILLGILIFYILIYSCCSPKVIPQKEEFKIKGDTSLQVELGKDLELFSNKIDSLESILNSIRDTRSTLDNLHNDSLFLTGKNTKKIDSLNSVIEGLNNKKVVVINKLSKGAYKDTVLSVRDTVYIKGDTSEYKLPYKLDMAFVEGKLYYDFAVTDSTLFLNKVHIIPTRKRMDRDISFFRWLKDSRTLLLLLILSILILKNKIR